MVERASFNEWPGPLDMDGMGQRRLHTTVSLCLVARLHPEWVNLKVVSLKLYCMYKCPPTCGEGGVVQMQILTQQV